ncbi:endonuclease NucS domain-containing protein [Pontibacillus yanchengensis]|nr:endonuclease NucS domain-containing protein [Pontibacillus yanchengensis]
MFKLNKSQNKLEAIHETTYFEYELKEREHIEEWIRKNPEVLQEELLIIGHEYDKFEVNERLDLLGLDQDGSLVIIEVKRDHTGAHVDIQALKYASYCSTLSPNDVIAIYEEYIQLHGLEVNATEEMMAFLNVEVESELHNMVNMNQRIIVVANEIDRRVLSVCTWLFENGIDIKCVTMKPYQLNGELIIDTNQIIPPYKLEDYYVKKKTSSKERKVSVRQDVANFLHEVAHQINNKTNYTITYNGRKDYIVGRKFLNIPWKFIFAKKQRDSFDTIYLESDKEQGIDLLKDIYYHHKENMSNAIGYELELTHGPRNTELFKLVIKVGYDEGETEEEHIQKYVNAFIEYKNFIEYYCHKYQSS